MEMIISNPTKLQEEITRFKKDGKTKFHVLADFDKTLTTPYINGALVPSVISILRDKNYISPEYSEKAKALANHYRTIEFDSEILEAKKRRAMEEWWTKHFDLLAESGLNKKHLERIVQEGGIEFREGVEKFIETLHKEGIPLVVLSSSGVGDTIKMILEQKKMLYDNIYVITNRFIYGAKGEVLGVEKPIIHSMNKDETIVRNFPLIYKEIESRKNVLLLGDGLGDLGMVSGFEHEGLIKVGFLDEDNKANQEAYSKAFDIVLTDNADFEEANKLLEEVLGK
jgi:cytosolic 5'-nucleotidase 3